MTSPEHKHSHDATRHEAAAQHDDHSRDALQKESEELRVFQYTSKRGVTNVSEIAENLFRRITGHDPSSKQLDAYTYDAYRRNNLTTPEQKFHIVPGEHLKFASPTVFDVADPEAKEAAIAKSESHTSQARPIEPARAEAPALKQVQSKAPPATTQARLETAKIQAGVEPTEVQVNHGSATAPVKVEQFAAAPSAKAASAVAIHHALTTSGEPACSDYEREKVGAWVSENEIGHRSYTTFNPNDAGHGVSVGIMQWNQKVGKLPDLLRAFHASDPRKFDSIFGEHAKEALSNQWVKTADFNSPQLKHELLQSLAVFSNVQNAMKGEQIEIACKIAREFQLTALRGVGVIADLVNHAGPVNTRGILESLPGESTANQSHRIDALEELAKTYSVSRIDKVHDKVKQIWRANAVANSPADLAASASGNATADPAARVIAVSDTTGGDSVSQKN